MGFDSQYLSKRLAADANETTSLYAELGCLFDVSGDVKMRPSIQGSLSVRVRLN